MYFKICFYFQNWVAGLHLEVLRGYFCLCAQVSLPLGSAKGIIFGAGIRTRVMSIVASCKANTLLFVLSLQLQHTYTLRWFPSISGSYWNLLPLVSSGTAPGGGGGRVPSGFYQRSRRPLHIWVTANDRKLLFHCCAIPSPYQVSKTSRKRVGMPHYSLCRRVDEALEPKEWRDLLIHLFWHHLKKE